MAYVRPSASQNASRRAPRRSIKKYLLPMHNPTKALFSRASFITVHYIYFTVACLLTSVILWGASTPARSVRYIDAIFLTTSAVTEAGLVTLNLSTLNTFQQIMLFALIIVGSPIFVSSAMIIIRKRAYEARLQELVDRKNARKEQQSPDAPLIRTVHRQPLTRAFSNHLVQIPELVRKVTYNRSNSNSGQAVETADPRAHRDSPTTKDSTIKTSTVRSLTSRERRELGGIEYDALCLLAWLVPLYVFLFQLLGAIGCGTWMQLNRPHLAEANGLNPFWTGAFFAVSAFNNSGMSLLDLNMTVLQDSYYMLLTMSLLILAGNTCFPPFLRLVLWVMKMSLPTQAGSRWERWRRIIKFTLLHPRRVYTHLFPSEATWWLVLALVLFNGVDWFAFEVFNITNSAITSIPARYRAIDGLFQAFAVRTGGFYVVSIASLYPATQVLYVLMMYLSAFPVTMTIRTTNLYKERSLPGHRHTDAKRGRDPKQSQQDWKSTGTEKGDKATAKHIRKIQSGPSTPFLKGSLQPRPSMLASSGWSGLDFVRHQLRFQLGHDLWLLAVACLLVTLIETSALGSDPATFSIFNILFELVSGYGMVGISVGVPGAAYSFSGAWHTGSKLVLCFVMLRGRHRGLPMTIDRAVLLPDESWAWAEEDSDDGDSGDIESGSKEREVVTVDKSQDVPGSDAIA